MPGWGSAVGKRSWSLSQPPKCLITMLMVPKKENTGS